MPCSFSVLQPRIKTRWLHKPRECITVTSRLAGLIELKWARPTSITCLISFSSLLFYWNTVLKFNDAFQCFLIWKQRDFSFQLIKNSHHPFGSTFLAECLPAQWLLLWTSGHGKIAFCCLKTCCRTF